MSNFARFVVRPNTRGCIIGMNVGAFREGIIYEVRNVVSELDEVNELIITDVGLSALGLDEKECMSRFGFSNGNDIRHLMHDNRYLMNIDHLDKMACHKK